jgi:glycerophosphoryl diester phosphodiesterase
MVLFPGVRMIDALKRSWSFFALVFIAIGTYLILIILGIWPVSRENPFVMYPYVAHALGSTSDGTTMTNSREAFEVSYAKGFRIFEVDLLRLSDGTVIAAHNESEMDYGLTGDFKDLTADDIEGAKWDGRYPIMTSQDLVKLLQEYKDSYLILDTKWDHVEIIATIIQQANPSVLNRMIPHITAQWDYDEIRDLYPFPWYMLALYRTQGSNKFDDDDVLKFVRENEIPAVMMWWQERDPNLSLKENAKQSRRFTLAFVQALREAGALPYVHSLSSADEIEKYRQLGVGVYSNGYFGD